MPKEISLFSGYSQKENRTTNYCLLLLKMLYEENPKFLGEALGGLADDEELGNAVGVKFQQQVRKANSVPDGVIFQNPFTLYIETKQFDWFYDKQLEAHLQALNAEAPGVKLLLALGNFEGAAEERFSRVIDLCTTRYEGSVYFAAATFEEFLAALRTTQVSKNLADTIEDFEAYLDASGLLPKWRTRLDVVNCSGRPQEVLEGKVYMCPATGGAYNHKRARFFGMYRNKRVGHLAEIEAVVEIESTDKAVMKWKNVKKQEASLLKHARELHTRWRQGQYPVRVFLLGEPHPTDFRRSTKGGMQTSKRYFDVSGFGAKDSAELATKLQGKAWDELEG